MTSRYRIRRRARTDLNQIVDFIAPRNSTAALKFLDAAVSEFRFLGDFCGAGVPRPSSHKSLARLRMWPIRGFNAYLIFYIPRKDFIEIIRVLHGARDVARILRLL